MKFPFPEIVPVYLLSHFIRGVFDGDGTLGIYQRKNGRMSYNVSIVGTYHLLRGIQKLCDGMDMKSTICQPEECTQTKSIRTREYCSTKGVS